MHAWLLLALIAAPLQQQGTTSPPAAARSGKAADQPSTTAPEKPAAAAQPGAASTATDKGSAAQPGASSATANDNGSSAQPADASGAQALADEPAVRQLCSSIERTGLLRFPGDPDPVKQDRARRAHEQGRTQALEKTYKVVVPSKGFAFGRYRSNDNLIELDGDRPLRAVDNTLSLDLAGIDDVAFPATPEQVSQWSQLKHDGKLSLVVTFKPADERCAGNAIAKSYRLAGTPQTWQLVGEGGQVLASAGEEPESATPGGTRSLQVVRLSLENDPTAEDEGGARLGSAQGALDKCAASAKRTGPLVVAFGVQGGRVRDAQVIMDGARDPQTSDCVARALNGATVRGANTGRGTATVAVK